jgi:AcrR family transcriptional regulator
MKISELSEYSKTPSATIRYYIKQGLLPEPIRTSMTMAYYTDDHMKGLQNIDLLKKQGLSLMAIKQKINTETHIASHKQETPTDIVYNSKRDKIVKAAVSLFRKKGYDATSIGEIIKKAGIGKGTFYQYFKNKELLFFECTDSVFYDIGIEIPQIRKEKDVMQRLWKRVLFFGRNREHMIDMLNLVRGASIKENLNFKEKLDDVIKNLVVPLQKELEIAISEKRIKLKDSILIAYLLMGAGEFTIYYHRDYEVNIDGLMRKAWDIALHGTYAADGPNKLPMGRATAIEHSVSQHMNSGTAKRIYVSPERRGKIISAAVDLFFQKGYAETSLADIANRARMSKDIFYIHFSNKDELFIDCADKIFHDMYNHVWQNIKEESDMLKRLWKRINAFFDSYPQWVVMMDLVRSLSVNENPVFKKKLFQLLRQIINPIIREIEQLRQEGRFRNDLDSAVSGYVFAGMIEYGASLINRKIYSKKKIIDYLDKILQHGIMGTPKTGLDFKS